MSPVAGLPPPVDLGFPDQFQSWRTDQLRAIDIVLQSDKRFIALTMPTGSGKSLTNIASALLQKGVRRACVLTSTKGLQDQYSQVFQPLGLTDVRGQRNYPCRALEPDGPLLHYRRGRWTPGCDEGPCHAGVRCKLAPDRSTPELRPQCDYYGAVHDARRADLVVTNYAYWLAQAEYGQGLGDFECLILDEAHHAPDEVESFLTFSLDDEEAQLTGSSFLNSADLKDWQIWAKAHLGPMRAMVETWKTNPPADLDGVKHIRKLESIVMKLDRLSGMKVDDWVLEWERESVEFSPLNSSAYAERALFRGIPKIILTSATLTRKTLRLLGVADDHVRAWECPSRFPVERRPVIHVSPNPQVRVTHRMTDGQRMLWRTRIDRLIEPRLDRKGVIHTVSYQRMVDLEKHSDFRQHFITHGRGDMMQQLEVFKRMKPPAIFVSPSIMTGIDLPYDQCRWQIIGKIPLLDMRGALLNARKDLDPDYQYYVAMQKLVQAVGRSTRAEDDWSEVFIVDDSFEWFIRRAKKFAPRWFMDAIEWTDLIPAPRFEV